MKPTRETATGGASRVVLEYGSASPLFYSEKQTENRELTTGNWLLVSHAFKAAGPADVFRPVYDELDAPPVAVSRVGRDADGTRRFCGCEAPLSGSR